MCGALSLVLTVFFLTLQCGCQKIVEGDHRQYVLVPVTASINTNAQIDPRNQIQQQSQLVYSRTRNYPSDAQYQPTAPLHHKSARQHISRADHNNNQPQQPIIEQYLKEVTPTTKTAYNPRHFQYTNNNDEKSVVIGDSENNKYYYNQENVNPEGTVLRQFVGSGLQYVKPQQEQAIQYIPAPRHQHIPYKPQPDKLVQNIKPVHKPVIYQPQQALLQKQEQTSSIQYLPEKRAPQKYKQSILDGEIDYYRKLQQKHQSLYNQERENIEHSTGNSNNNYYQQPELIHSEIPISRSPQKHQKQNPIYHLPEYQQVVNAEQLEYKNNYQSPTSSASTLFQPQQYKGGPKYLPDPTASKVTVQKNQSKQQQLQQQTDSYFDDILHKYGIFLNGEEQSSNEDKTKPTPAVQHPQQKYQQPTQHQLYEPQQQQSTPEYQSQTKYIQVEPATRQAAGTQQQQPVYQGPTDEEYKQSQFKQSLGINSSLRILKTGKPVVFIGHDE